MHQHNKKPYIVGINGGTGSGKSLYSSILTKNLSNSVILTCDGYYKGGDENTNFDHPDSIDFKYMIKQLKELKNNKSIQAPLYDFSTHSRKKETQTINPARVIIVEGILIFSVPELVELLDFRVYIEASSVVRYRRRLKRDVKERGRTEEEVDHRWDRDVDPCHKEFVESKKDIAHVIINNNKDISFKEPMQETQIRMIVRHIKGETTG